VTQGRLICVFGAAGQRCKQERPLLGRVLEKGADLGILTADNPGPELVDEIAHDLLDGFERPAKAHLIPDRAKAIHWALSQAEAGDTVLIAGKGNENGQRLGQRHIEFDDRAVARDWLQQHAVRAIPPRANFG
jgi:UDP-N-acetylmuramoyl-L-alanyl-D-glutamate--2,6-diaminopimelate ligase